MNDILSQRTMPWGNELLGKSKYYIHALGSVVTELAELMGVDPIEINDKLKAEDGFGPDATGELCEVVWDKIPLAFPEWTAEVVMPYDNQKVLDALAAGKFVVTFVDGAPVEQPGILLAVRYIGNGKCHDPWTGTERPTSDFPNVKGLVILTHNMSTVSTEMPSVPNQQEAPMPPLAEAQPEKTAVEQLGENIKVTLANLPLEEKLAIVRVFERATEEVKKILAL